MVVGAAVDDLSQLLTGLRGQDLSGVDVEDLAAEVVVLRRLVDGLEVEWTRRIAHLERSDVTALEGHTSITAFLKDRCRMSGARAQRAVSLSHRLPALPFVAKALETDDLSFDQVSVFTHLPDHLSDELAGAEVMLVNAAAPLTVADTRRLVEYWKTAVDGPGCEATVAELEERRYLHASRTFEGMVKVDGLFDPVTGDLILTAFDAAMPPPGRDDLRTSRQRRADALAHLARNFLDSGQAAGTEKPHVVVLTDLDALAGHGGGTHETMNGHVLTPEQVRRYACDCTISRIVFGPGSEILDIGRATRTVPTAMRRALNVRDRHCQHPTGCDRPARWCDAHHKQHWADGGPTALSNLTLLCQYHHTLEHRTGRPPPRRRARSVGLRVHADACGGLVFGRGHRPALE
jgi:Domain of unknown function (DUF222)/HNH endonuclease